MKSTNWNMDWGTNSMKKISTGSTIILFLSCLFLVSSCSISKEELETMEDMCKDRGGIKEIRGDTTGAECEDGLRFQLLK